MKQVTVITGGAGGMGYAIASVLGRQGDIVVLCDINEEALKTVNATLTRQNMDVHYCVVDVSKRDQVDAAAEKAANLGAVSKVINTAGLSPIQVSKMEAAAGARLIVEVNARGTINMLEAFFPLMAEGGVFIGFSSSAIYHMPVYPEPIANVFHSVLTEPESLCDKIYALTGGAPGKAYMFSKCFVKRYCEMNVGRLGHKGCRIVTIAPGRIFTPMHRALIDAEPERIAGEMASMPLGRYGNAYEIANLVDFLCSYRASYISGIDILMDDGTQAFSTTPQFPD